MSDPRVTLARPDLAADTLEGLIAAARYAPTTVRVCAAPSTAIRRAPDDQAEQWDQLLFGEPFQVLETRDGWAWGQASRDGYVGYVAVADLAPQAAAPSHWVSSLRTYAFSEPDIKSAPVGLYSLNALVSVEAHEGRFARGAGTGWFIAAHLSLAGVFLDHPADVAERFLGAPYLWGGRESLGLDCSGLVQQALFACGHGCPRDTDQQSSLGRSAPAKALQRGDLVFWPGHVAMMLDDKRIMHANAHHMAVAIEPLADAVGRIEASTGHKPSAYRRV